MSKTIYLPRGDSGRYRAGSGIDITWTPSAQRLDIGGWYDSFVGIESSSMTLREFFEMLGIKEADCKRAFRKERGL